MSEKKFKVGDKVRVVGNKASHDFEINTEVKITMVDNSHDVTYDYKCEQDDNWDWCAESDLEGLQPQAELLDKGIEHLLELLAQHGGTIESTGSLSVNEINQARASGRMYVDNNSLGYVWMPKFARDFPTTVEEIELFDKYYPLDVPLPAELETLDWLHELKIKNGIAAMIESKKSEQPNKDVLTEGSGGFKIQINNKEFVTNDRYLTGMQLKQLVQCDITYGVWIKNYPEHDKEVHDNEQVDLNQPGRQQYFTGSKFTTEGSGDLEAGGRKHRCSGIGYAPFTDINTD